MKGWLQKEQQQREHRFLFDFLLFFISSFFCLLSSLFSSLSWVPWVVVVRVGWCWIRFMRVLSKNHHDASHDRRSREILSPALSFISSFCFVSCFHCLFLQSSLLTAMSGRGTSGMMLDSIHARVVSSWFTLLSLLLRVRLWLLAMRRHRGFMRVCFSLCLVVSLSVWLIGRLPISLPLRNLVKVCCCCCCCWVWASSPSLFCFHLPSWVSPSPFALSSLLFVLALHLLSSLPLLLYPRVHHSHTSSSHCMWSAHYPLPLFTSFILLFPLPLSVSLFILFSFFLLLFFSSVAHAPLQSLCSPHSASLATALLDGPTQKIQHPGWSVARSDLWFPFPRSACCVCPLLFARSSMNQPRRFLVLSRELRALFGSISISFLSVALAW